MIRETLASPEAHKGRTFLAERGFTVDEAGFQKAMQVQRETARKARKTTNYMGEAQTAYQQIDPTLTTEFTGYDRLTDEGKITAMVRILPDESEEDATALTEALAEGDEGTGCGRVLCPVGPRQLLACALRVRFVWWIGGR